MAQNGLDTDIQFLPGVGPKRAALMKKELAVETVGQLLRLYPFRYIDRSSFVRICDIRPDMAFVQIKAVVLRSEVIDKKRLSVWISDGTGELETVFFKGMKWMAEKLVSGAEFVFFGKPTAFNGRINMVHPEVDAPGEGLKVSYGAAGGTMTGVYPSTEKLKNGGVTGKVMNKLMEAAISRGLTYIEESLPEYIMKQYGLVPLHFALRNIHFPKDMVSLEKAKYRLKFEELFYLQLSLL
jgi:ATP-dependent DNA helicase RecG